MQGKKVRVVYKGADAEKPLDREITEMCNGKVGVVIKDGLNYGLEDDKDWVAVKFEKGMVTEIHKNNIVELK